MAKKFEEIKEEEYPYELPEGWKWERLGNISEVVSGGTPSSKVKEYYNGDIAWITPADLSGYKKRYISRGAKNITKTGLDKSSAKLIPKDTVLLSSRAPIGYVVIAKNELSTNQGFKNFLPSDDYLPQYLYWYLKGNKELLESYASGTTFLELSASKAKMIEIPLAPKETQQKIVDIIESLFAKLDIAQEKVEQVLAESENRRSAILHNAFSGKLTEKWREENNILFDTWNEYKIKEVSTPRAGYAFDSKKFCNSGYQVIRMGNLYGGELLLDRSPVYYDENDVDVKILNRSLLQDKDIVITLTGTKYKRDYGYAVCLYEPYKLLLNQRCMSLTANGKIIEYRYLLYYLKSNQFRDIFFSNETGGVNQGNVSSKFVENIEITLPLRQEQQEIVRLLDKFLSVEDKVKFTCQNTLEAIATMRKSILAKAFRGELCS